jgi:hypothetical protein
VVAISASGGHSLALKSDGTVVAWGGNLSGQANVPTGLNSVIAIAAGGYHSLALLRQPSPPSAVARISPLFQIRPSETNLLIFAPNNSTATVVLDATRSSDADNDPLQFSWYANGQAGPVGTGVVATNQFAIGAHTVTLAVSDGCGTATAQVSFEVITPAAAVGQLLELVDNANLGTRNPQPLLATLFTAMSSFDRGDVTAALNQLSTFQNKVRVQIKPQDAALAEQFISASQQIIAAMARR